MVLCAWDEQGEDTAKPSPTAWDRCWGHACFQDFLWWVRFGVLVMGNWVVVMLVTGNGCGIKLLARSSQSG